MVTPGILLLLVVGVVVLVVLVLLVAMAASGSKKNNPNHSSSVGGQIAPASDRDELFREKHQHYNEERSRILKMVDEGKISAEEADRLFSTLERETTMMACPFCREEIKVAAVKCKHCGSYLAVGETARKGRLTKSNDKVLAGVCGGLAEYLDCDPALIRIGVVLLGLFTAVLPLLLVYIIAAILLPQPGE